MTSLRTPVGRARGLGSAREGAHHWWVQRVSAVALVPLTLWFVVSVLGLMGADHQTMVGWVQNPVTASLLIALIAATFYHAALGMQVIFEDYLEPRWLELSAIVATKLICALLGIASAVSVLMIAFGG
jgi:succinate dehydrogenase / fumarate reductase membrane anchor subunit